MRDIKCNGKGKCIDLINIFVLHLCDIGSLAFFENLSIYTKVLPTLGVDKKQIN